MLQVGCGPGQCVTELAPHFKCVYGFDTSSEQIAIARQTVKASNVQFNVRVHPV